MAIIQAPSLDRLLIETRQMLNQPNASNSFWSNAELTTYLNDAVSMYFQEVSERVEGQFDDVSSLDVVAGTETVALPTDCFEVKAVYMLNGDTYTMLNYRNNLTESYYAQGTDTDSTTYAPYYYFRGNSLVLRPIPNFSLSSGIKIEYTKFPETMIWGGDTLTSGISPVFKELIVLYAVYKAKVKESLTTGTVTYQAASQLLGDTYLRFQNCVGQRSKNPTYTIAHNPEGY